MGHKRSVVVVVMGQSVGDECLVFSGTGGDARELVCTS